MRSTVTNGLCEHASSAVMFASMGSDQICLASSEHFRNKNSEQRALREISATQNLSLMKRNGVLRQEIRLTPFNQRSELFTAITSGSFAREIGSLQRQTFKEI